MIEADLENLSEIYLLHSINEGYLVSIESPRVPSMVVYVYSLEL